MRNKTILRIVSKIDELEGYELWHRTRAKVERQHAKELRQEIDALKTKLKLRGRR